MPHLSIKRRKPATATALTILLAFGMALASLGLAACGGSSSSASTPAAANAAATGASTTGAATTGASTTGTATTGTATTTTGASGSTSSGAQSTGTAPKSTTPSPTAPAPGGRPNAARFAAIRACLQKDGITLPQRSGSGGFRGAQSGAQLPKGMTRAQFTEALRKCGGGGVGGHFGGVPRALQSPRFRQALAQFAACLRQNGINVPTPNTSGKGPIFSTKGINTASPQFRAASMKCRGALLSGLRSKSAGAGGGA